MMVWTSPARHLAQRKSRAKMVVVETHLKEKLWGVRRRSGIIVAG
jgi:hypothetical protein